MIPIPAKIYFKIILALWAACAVFILIQSLYDRTDGYVIRLVNKNMDVNGIHLLQAEHDLLRTMGKSEKIYGVAGYRYIYPEEGLSIGIGIEGDQHKVMSITTTNPRHHILGLKVGSALPSIDENLKLYRFEKQDSPSYHRGPVYLYVQSNHAIESMTIRYVKQNENISY